MSRMKPLKPGEKVGLKVTLAERTLLLNVMHDLPDKTADVIRNTPTVQPIMLTFNDLDDLYGNVSAVADRTKDKKLQKRLDAISEKIQNTRYRYHEEPKETDRPDTISFLDRFVEFLGQPGPRIVPLPTKSKRGEDQYGLKLTDNQRESLIHCTELSKGLMGKIQQADAGTQTLGFTRDELDELASEVDLAVDEARSPHKKRLAAVYLKLESLLDALEHDEANEPRQPIANRTGTIYQFKVTLRGSKPPIWRRFQVPDCSLRELHEILQVVMDWGNCHLHQFIIRGECFGPVESEDSLRNEEIHDEEETSISQVVKMVRKVRFTYEYDFGDGWQHEIVLEKTLESEPDVAYPQCIDGARACPPEDVGGIWGYGDFLVAISDPNHENHAEMVEWVGGEFDPEKFSVDDVNRELGEPY